MSLVALAETLAHESGHVDQNDVADGAVVEAMVRANLLTPADSDAVTRTQETIADLYASVVAGVIDPNPSAPESGQWLVQNIPFTAPDHPDSAERLAAMGDLASKVSDSLVAALQQDGAPVDGADAGATVGEAGEELTGDPVVDLD